MGAKLARILLALSVLGTAGKADMKMGIMPGDMPNDPGARVIGARILKERLEFGFGIADGAGVLVERALHRANREDILDLSGVDQRLEKMPGLDRIDRLIGHRKEIWKLDIAPEIIA